MEARIIAVADVVGPRFDAGRGAASWVNAGQVYPLLRRAGQVRELEQPSYPLGVRRDLSFPVRRTELEPGDLLLLLTDGYVEAWNRSGDPFGWERLADRLRRFTAGGPAALLDRLAGDLEQGVARPDAGLRPDRSRG